MGLRLATQNRGRHDICKPVFRKKKDTVCVGDDDVACRDGMRTNRRPAEDIGWPLAESHVTANVAG